MAHPPVPARRDGRHRPGLPHLARAQRRLHRHAGHRAVVRVQRPGLRGLAEPWRRPPPGHLVAVELRGQRRRRRQAVDPRRPAVDLHVPGRLGRLDAHPPVLDLVHVGGPRLRPLLLLSELLRLLDAAARPGGQLPAAHRRLGVRGRGLLPAHLLLVPAAHRHLGRHQGVRHQRFRRCRPRARDVLHLQAHRHGRSSSRPSTRSTRSFIKDQTDLVVGLSVPARRRVRQVGPGAAAHVVARRHGGPDPGLGPDPRGHDGHRGRLPDRPHAPAVRARPDRRRRGRDHRLCDAR